MKERYGRAVEALLRDFWERPLPDFTSRDVELLSKPGKADVLVGMRRSGKTYRLYQEMAHRIEAGLAKERVLYLNLEDDRLGEVGPGLLSEALETFYRLQPGARDEGASLFLDEVQRVSDWPRFLRRVLDTERVQAYISGSSSKLLSSEVATEFRGRGFATEVLPFSFRETVRHAGVETPERPPGARMRSRLEALLDRYLDTGGMPEVQEYDEPARIQTLQDYVEIVIVRDVVERHGLTNIAAVRALARAALGSSGSLFSVHKVHRDFQSRGLAVGKDTLYALMGHFEDSFLLFQVPTFRRSERARQTTPRKLYAVDPALAMAVTHVTAQHLGARLETAVYLELRRRGNSRREGSISYYRTRAGREVDFIVGSPDESPAVSLIQVCAHLENEETRTRELVALEEAMAECGARHATVITLRSSGTLPTAHGDIYLVPAWEWLSGLGPGARNSNDN